MTGRYPARISIGLLEPWIPSPRDNAIGLSSKDFSIATSLQDVGYETALIGKWHLGTDSAFAPRKNGFGYFYGIKTGAADYISHRGDSGIFDMFENETLINPKGYMTELLASKAMEYLKHPHPNPFFLSLQFTAPHWPWQGPDDKELPDSLLRTAKGMSSNGSPAIYAAMMTSLDDQVGRITRLLNETGLSKNTVIIFTSDNGGEKFSDMGSFAKRKMNVWEGGVRIPAIVKWPGKVEPNSTSTQQVITMDWSATILAIAGARTSQQFPLDGISLIPFLNDSKKVIERTFYWRLTQRTKQHAVLEGKWKYIHDQDEDYLFDLSTDPGEKINLKLTEDKKFRQLHRKYLDWEKTVLKPIAL